MAVDIEGFDIVFSAANANNARAIDQSIARMSEKVPTLSMGISDMAKALETLGKLNIDGVKKNLDAVKNSIENIDGSKLNKAFELATAQSEGLLNSVTSLVNMLGKVDLSSLRGGAKTEIYDERSRVAITKEAGNESQIPIKFDERTILLEIKNISDRLAMLFKDIPVSLRKELDLTFFAEKANELKKMFAGITLPVVVGQSVPKELSIDNKKIEEAATLVKDLHSDLAEKIEKTGTSSSTVFEKMHKSLSTLIDDIAVLQQNVNAFDAKNVKLPKPQNAQTVLPNDEYFISANKMQETVAMYEKAQQKLSRLEEEYKKVKAAEEAADAGSIKGKISKFLLQLSEDEEKRTSDVIQREINNVKRIINSLEEEKRALRENMNEQIRKGQVSESVSQTERKATERNIAGLREEIKERKRSLQEGEGITRAEGRQQSAVDELAQAKAELKKQETSLTEQLKKQYEELLKLDKIYEKLSAREYLNSKTGGKSGDLTSQEIQLQEKINEEIQKREALIQANTALSTKEGQSLKANYELELLRIKAENDRWIAEQQKRYESKPSTTTKKKDTTEADLEKEILALMKEKLKLTEKQRSIEQKSNVNGGVSQEEVNLYNAIVDRLNVINNELSQLASKHTTVYDNAAQKTYLDGLEMEVRLRKELDALLKASNKTEKSPEEIRIENLVKEYKSVLSQMQTVEKAQAQANKTLSDKNATQDEKDRAQKILNDTTHVYEQLAQRRVEIEQETNDKIVALRNKAAATIAKAEAQRLKQEQKDREQKAQIDPNAAIEYAKNAKSINDLNIALKNLKKVMSEAVPNEGNWNALNKTYQETKKRLDEIKKSMEGVKEQTNSIIPSLQNLAMQFGLVFSIQQLNQWIKHMVDVRAQFELQNIALRSIIQNKEKADQIFAEVQQLALKSPFSIMQLNSYTKQMAAYGVEADKLVGVTKQLADVSAGLGVEMGRLILAYGQVKTANYLRATEVRQFTEAGLNITQELANYFTELNGKMVTAGEVTEMITKRMVKFEDVAEVFKRVTSAGGMFYEMQEKQSEGLQGQIQRIGDAYSIMLNQIGKNNQGLISKVLSTIRELISSWRSVSSVITVAAAATIAYIAATKLTALITTLGKVSKSYKLIAFATDNATAAQLRNNAAVVANPYALAAAAIAVLVAGIYELTTSTNQLTEDLTRMQEEVFNDAINAVSNYQKLADTVRDVTKSYSERKDAMDEIKRAYGDILPKQMLEMEGIIAISDGYKDASDAIREYYRIKLEEEQKATIGSEYSTQLSNQAKKIAEPFAQSLKEYGASTQSVRRILDDIINQLKEGTIKSATSAGETFAKSLIKYYNITDKTVSDRLISNAKSNLHIQGLAGIASEYRETLEGVTDMNERFVNITDERTHAALQLINKDFEQVEERVKKVGLAFSKLDELRTLNERAGGTGFDIAKIETAVSDKKTGNLTAEEQKVAAALQEIDKALASVGMTGKYAWQQIYDATANNIAQTEWFGAVQKTAFTSFLQNLNQAKYHTNELAKTKFAEKLQAKIDGVDGSPTVKEIRRIVKAVADANNLDYHLFDWLTLDVKTSFESAGKEFDTQLKAFHEKILSYKEMMKIMYVTGQSEQDILNVLGLTKEQIGNAPAIEKSYQQIKTAMGKLDKETKTKKTNVADKTEQTLRERIKLIKEANKTFEKYSKEYDKVIAKEKTYNDLMDRAKELNIADILKKDDLTNTATLEAMQNVYNKFKSLFKNKKYVGAKRDALKEMSDMKFEISVELNENNRKELQDSFDKMFGGYQLFIELDKIGINQNLAKDMFDIDYTSLDEIGARWKQLFLDKINDEYKQMDVSFAGFKTYEEAKEKLSQDKSNKNYEMAVNTEKKISEAFNKELESRMKEYAKYLKKSYSESVNEQVNVYRQLRQLQMDADFKRNAIIGNNKLDEKQKQTALQELDAQSSQIAAKMQEQLQEKLNKIQWESFKDSPLFETVLSDIENLGTATLDMLIKRLGDLKETYKGLDPKIVKELTKYTDQLTKQKIKNNPFKEWGNALREIHALKKQGLTLDKLNENLISDSDELTRLSAEIESYNKVLAIKQQMTHVTEQDIKLMQTDTQTLERQLRVLEEQKRNKSGAGVGVDGSDESKAMDLQIKKIQEILAARRTILASNGDNIVLSSQEIALLQQESDEITKQVLLLAKKKGLKEEDIEKIKAQIGSWDKLSESQKGAISILNEVGSAASAGFAVAEAAMDAFGGSSDEVTKAMLQGFDDCLQACLSLTTSIIAMGEAANAASGIIGIIAASLTAVATLFKTIFNVHDAKLEKSIKEHQRQVKKLEAEYDELSDAISNAFSGFQLGTNTQASIQNLERQNEQYRAMIENEKDKKDSDEDQIADWQQTIKDNLKKAQELRQQYFNELGGLGTGSDVRDAAEGFVDAWADAFGETSDGISGLKEQFNDFMKNIVKKQAYMKIADHWINKFGDMINASFDKYGQVNYEKLQQAMQWFTEEAMPQMDTALEDMNAFWERLGINWTGTTSNLSGLAAGIQGVTEETAQILEALLNSMRFYVADTNEQLKSILNTMNGANEENPFLKELKNQTKYLASIDKRLDSVISATKRASGSHINVFTT